MHLPSKNMLEAIRCHFLRKNFPKILWLDRDFPMTTWKTGMKKIIKDKTCVYQSIKKKYAKQRNYCVSLLWESKKRYYENLDEKTIVDNKPFLENNKTVTFW